MTSIGMLSILALIWLYCAKRPQRRVVALEGNISAGKSYICKHLNGRVFGGRRIHIVLEKMPSLLLKLFYTEAPESRRERLRYPFTLQLYTLSKRADAFAKARQDSRRGTTTLLDRSMLGDFLFACKHYLDGNISDDEVAVYLQEAGMKSLGQFLLRELDQIIYLHTTPDRCHASLVQRGDVDKDAKHDYLYVLDNLHFYGVLWLKLHFPDVRICVRDWREFGNPVDILQYTGHCGSVAVVTEVEIASSSKNGGGGGGGGGGPRVFKGNELKDWTVQAIAGLPAHIHVDFEAGLQRMDGESLPKLPLTLRHVHSQTFKNLVMGALAQNKQVTFVRTDSTRRCLLDWFDKGLQEFMPNAA